MLNYLAFWSWFVAPDRNLKKIYEWSKSGRDWTMKLSNYFAVKITWSSLNWDLNTVHKKQPRSTKLLRSWILLMYQKMTMFNKRDGVFSLAIFIYSNLNNVITFTWYYKNQTNLSIKSHSKHTCQTSKNTSNQGLLIIILKSDERYQQLSDVTLDSSKIAAAFWLLSFIDFVYALDV